MTDLRIRTEGRAGRITLDRPRALNAVTHDMVRGIDTALRDWETEPGVEIVVIDGTGDRAFCAGGDVTSIYRAVQAGNLEGPRTFWRDEYRMNARIARYPKPVISLMQGYVMGGGVGVGCHAAHRVVGRTTRISMPEVGIGLVPDVGGSLLLARAPGRLGEYLGTTAARMDAAAACFAGFADYHVPEAAWPDLVAQLCGDGDPAILAAAHRDPGPAMPERDRIDLHFAAPTLPQVIENLSADPSDWARETEQALAAVSPLAAAITLGLIHAVREAGTIEAALELEYRVTSRSVADGDFIEGIRARIIDKDQAPRWRHADPRAVGDAEVADWLAPLGAGPHQEEGQGST